MFINGIMQYVTFWGYLFYSAKFSRNSSKLLCVSLLLFTRIHTHTPNTWFRTISEHICSEPFENSFFLNHLMISHHAFLAHKYFGIASSKNKDIHLQNHFVIIKKSRKLRLLSNLETLLKSQ